LFYDSCQNILIKRENSFSHNKRESFSNYEFNDKDEEIGIVSLHQVLKMMSNTYYILSMGLILSLLVPDYFFIHCKLFSNSISKLARIPSTDSEKNKKIIKKKNIQRKLVLQE
jgi:high-affinity Fe2+/Pb2+ permease